MTGFSSKPTLRGRRVLLHPHTPADIEATRLVLDHAFTTTDLFRIGLAATSA